MSVFVDGQHQVEDDEERGAIDFHPLFSLYWNGRLIPDGAVNWCDASSLVPS